MWDGVAAAVTGRRSWLLGLGVVLLAIGFMVLIGGNAAAGQAPLSVPADSDSAKVEALARQFPGGDRVPLIVVVNRADGARPGFRRCERRSSKPATGCRRSPRPAARPPAPPPHRRWCRPTARRPSGWCPSAPTCRVWPSTTRSPRCAPPPTPACRRACRPTSPEGRRSAPISPTRSPAPTSPCWR